VLEKHSGGRLGVAVLNTATNASFAWRGDERFAFCSTFKFLLAAAILQRIDHGQESATRHVPITKADLLSNSPVTETYIGKQPPTVETLLQALIEYSDNAAANLMLASLGGPPALTQIFRAWGDPITRIDRTELSLNEATPGDPRDTTSPNAMLENLHRIALGNSLAPASRAKLITWMKNCQTGQNRLRGGLPSNWIIGDKTGTNTHGTANDIAIIWRPFHAPILVTCYLTESTLPPEAQNAIHASVAQALTADLKAG
jgi:beta-lactamase class A